MIALNPSAGNAQQPERVERLTVATEGDKGNLTPYSFRPPPGLHTELIGLVYDTLFLSPYTDEPIPWLATEASASEDARTWTVKLRDDVTWQDGEKFTAEDVAFTYNYYREGPSNRYSHHASEVPVVESAEVLDPYTVRLTCNLSCPTLALITLADLPILPEHIWKNVEDPQTYSELPMGTGPYRLVEYTEDQFYRFEANEDYFLGPPTVKQIDMPIVPDPSSMFLALQSGQVDSVTLPVPPELEERLDGTGNIELMEGERFSSLFYRFNAERPPLDRQEFRNALDTAIDRQELVDTVLLGSGRAGSPSFMHPKSRWFEPQDATFDPEQARAILDKTGITDSDRDGVRESNGEPVNLSVIVPANDPQQVRAAELTAQQLQEIGVGLEVQSLDPGTLSQRQNAGEFDLTSSTGVPHLLGDPTQLVQSLDTFLVYTNPEYPELRSEWMEATTVERFSESLSEIQRLFGEDPPAFTLYSPNTTYAYDASAYDRWIPVEGHGIFQKWSFIPAAPEMLGVERATQSTPLQGESGAGGTQDADEGGTSPYVLAGAGMVIVLALAGLLWWFFRRTGEEEI